MVHETTKPLMKVVLREDIIALTGDHISALILQQLLYWGTKKGYKEFNKFIEEEREREEDSCEDLQNCWIWKKVDELKQELLLVDVSKSSSLLISPVAAMPLIICASLPGSFVLFSVATSDPVPSSSDPVLVIPFITPVRFSRFWLFSILSTR